MRNRRNTLWALLFGAALVALVLTGCRAFVPEAVIVNKAPETYIIGAPLEHGGGYYHFHVYWYGSDSDGKVERFVWALTDTTVQDEDTTDDEEDARFNPALDATTLEIAQWTTRTDSIFDFRIDQGTRPSADFTLHMVAIDDMGAMDRTPARLHFFSNTLGNPQIRFFRIVFHVENNDTTSIDTIPLAPGQADTVGFLKPYTVGWAGSSPNIRGYDPEALARADTVYPFDDGLFGYKWQILGELGGNCVPSLIDCWHPRRFDEASGDSFSVFSGVNSLTFHNDGSSAVNPFRKLLPSGTVSLLVNSVDVAGVEVAEFQRSFEFLVNFDPQTIILDNETDWAHPEDPQVYPYYFRLNDPTRTRVPFSSGDRIPDRTYVVVKALARDDPRDERVRQDFGIGLAGYVQGARSSLSGGTFRFATETSALDTIPAWGSGVDGWYADTLGFLTGPRTNFTFNMQAVDEHGRRDGSPAQLQFDVGYPPCMQCIEVLPKTASVSAFPPSVECYEPDTGPHPCFGDTAEYSVTLGGTGTNDLQWIGSSFMAINRGTGFTQIVTDTTGLGRNNYLVRVRTYNMTVLLHGQDDPLEAWSQPVNRAMAWRYQVDYECDPFNQIKDGGGNDDIERYTWSETTASDALRVDTATGLWRMRVTVAVPSVLIESGAQAYWFSLLFDPNIGNITDMDAADYVFSQSLRQLGLGTVRAVVLDQSQCSTFPVRPTKYSYFRAVRPSVATLPGTLTWRSCNLPTSIPGVKDGLDLSQGAMESSGGEPVTRYFRLIARIGTATVDCNTPPPRP